MYIDTEGTFRPERLLAVAERSVLMAGSKQAFTQVKKGMHFLMVSQLSKDQPGSLNSLDCQSKTYP